jgi:hypothetical protein
MGEVDAMTFSLGLFQPKEEAEDRPRFAFLLGMDF